MKRLAHGGSERPRGLGDPLHPAIKLREQRVNHLAHRLRGYSPEVLGHRRLHLLNVLLEVGNDVIEVSESRLEGVERKAGASKRPRERDSSPCDLPDIAGHRDGVHRGLPEPCRKATQQGGHRGNLGRVLIEVGEDVELLLMQVPEHPNASDPRHCRADSIERRLVDFNEDLLRLRPRHPSKRRLRHGPCRAVHNRIDPNRNVLQVPLKERHLGLEPRSLPRIGGDGEPRLNFLDLRFQDVDMTIDLRAQFAVIEDGLHLKADVSELDLGAVTRLLIDLGERLLQALLDRIPVWEIHV